MRRTNPPRKYNCAKFLILSLLEPGDKFYSPREIASATGLSLSCVKAKLTSLSRWGYLWRALNQGRGRHKYVYQNLKPKAVRMLGEWQHKKDIEAWTGISISLNRKKTVSPELLDLYHKLKQEAGTEAEVA